MFRILEHFNLSDLYRIVSEYDHQPTIQTSSSPPEPQVQATTIQRFMGSVVTPTKRLIPGNDYDYDNTYSIDNARQQMLLSVSPVMSFTPNSHKSSQYEYTTPRLSQSHMPATQVRRSSDFSRFNRSSLDYTVNFTLEESESDNNTPSPTLGSMSGTPLKMASPGMSPRMGYSEYGTARRGLDGINLTFGEDSIEIRYDFTLSIVGRDPQGNILLCVNKDNGWTFLDVFTFETLELEQLFCWNEVLLVTNAVFNTTMKLIGITVKRSPSTTSSSDDLKLLQRSGAGKDAFIYQSFVVCTDDLSRTKHVMSEPSVYPQKVHFLLDENTTRKSSLSAAPTPTKAVTCSYTSYFLVTTLSQSIVVYNIQARVKKSLVTTTVHEETTIYRQPRKETLIINEHIWSKYDPETKLLHFIPRPKGGKLKDSLSICTLVRVPMGDTRFRASGEWKMSQCFAVPQSLTTNPAWDMESPFPYVPPHYQQVGSPSSATVAPLPSVSVVTLSGPNSACLCIQHEFDMRDADDVLVPISVVHLATQTRIDYSIPVPKRATKSKQFGKLRVLFDTAADYLIVYIPGVFLHLLDLSLIHNPTAGLSFVGIDATPLCPQVSGAEGPDDFYSIAPFPLSYCHCDEDDSTQKSFLDLSTGMVYDYSYDRKFIVGLVGGKAGIKKVDPIKVMHMALVHLRDDEIVERIIAKMLSSPSELVPPGLFKEYILGETFCTMKRVLPPNVLSGVPPTAIDQNIFISVF